MVRFSKILFYADPVTNLQPALRYAVRLATADNAEVTLVDCVDKEPPFLARALLPSSWDIQGVVAHDHQSRLETLARTLSDQGVRTSTRLLLGTPADEITRLVIRDGCDLVIKTAAGVGPRREGGLFGGTAIRLMRNCPCPVCVVDPAEDERFDRILAAVNPQCTDPQHAELNDSVLEFAASFAQRENGQLHVLHAWTPYAESVLSTRMFPDQIAEIVASGQAAARKQLDNLLARHNLELPAEQIHVEHGDVEQTIADFVTRNKLDLVVMGVVARGGLMGTLLGNTTEQIIQRVPCSLLAVKPSGFTSPISVDERMSATADPYDEDRPDWQSFTMMH